MAVYKSRADDHADAIVQMILAHYSSAQFNVTLLAEKIGKSPSFLREVIHTAYGMSLQELIETIRLAQAVKLLAANRGMIDFVRSQTGYAYAKTFRVAFKRRLGFTPQECRALLAATEDRQFEVKRLLRQLWGRAHDI